MIKSKVIDIFRTFSSQELKDFRDFIYSPFHNKNKKVRILFETVKKHAPNYDSRKLEKEKLFKILYPDKKYNDTVMRILLSDLMKLAEEFLIHKKLRAEPITGKRLLLEEFKDRNLNKLFSRHFKLAEEILSKSGIINHYYFLDLYSLKNTKIDFMINRDKQMLTSSDVQKQGEYLIFFSLIGLLNIVHELLTQEEVLNIRFNVSLVEEYLKHLNLDALMEYLEKNNYEYYPVAAIYYYMYKAYRDNNNDEYFFKLRKFIEENLHLFGREEKFNLLIILESICINKVSIGKTEYYDYLMNIYEFMIDEKLLTITEKDYIQTNLVRNIFYTAIILEWYQWAEKFIEKYLPRVNPQQKENLLNYSRALICFERKEFGKSLESMSKVNQRFFPFKFDAKVLTLKIYFEMEDFEPALSLIDSFYHFLSKNKNVHVFDKERFGSFLKYLKYLIKLKTNRDGLSPELLTRKISQNSSVIAKKWLLEKASGFNKPC